MTFRELNNLPLNRLLIIDIETVSQYPNYEAIDSERYKNLWDNFVGKRYLKNHLATSPQEREKLIAERYQQEAAIIPEFGKIVCVGMGFFSIYEPGESRQLKVKGFASTDERALLTQVRQVLEKLWKEVDNDNQQPNGPHWYLAGHNIKEFDLPYLCRRMVIQELLPLPRIIDLAGKEPWQTPHLIDTMRIWLFGDRRRGFVSLELLAQVLGLPTPKEHIDGSQVGEYYWQRGDLDSIARYCLGDVVTVANIILKWRGEQPLREEEILTDGSN